MLILTILKIIGWIIAGAFGLAVLGCALIGAAVLFGLYFYTKEKMKKYDPDR